MFQILIKHNNSQTAEDALVLPFYVFSADLPVCHRVQDNQEEQGGARGGEEEIANRMISWIIN